MMHGHGESDSAIVAAKPTNKAGQLDAELVERRAGAEGECEPAKHAPGTVPGARVTSAGAHTARRENIAKRRYTPEVGAVCLNWARTDLCGGREVTRVPTAIKPSRAKIHLCPLLSNSGQNVAVPRMSALCQGTKSLRDSSPAEAERLVCEHGGRG